MNGPTTAEFGTYGNKQSREAIDARKKLPREIQSALMDIIDDICDNPLKYPRRIRKISRDGSVVVYRHPDPPIEITYEIDEKEKLVYFMHYAVTVVNLRKKVFVSYSHEDGEWLEQLKKWLKPLERGGLLDIWDDTKIKPGEDWREEIKDALSSAKLAVLLVSQNFLASDFIGGEELAPILESAKKEGVSVLWIAVSEAAYEETGIERFQALNDPKTPLDCLDPKDLNKQLKDIYIKIKETAEA